MNAALKMFLASSCIGATIAGAQAPALNPIRHIVVVIQENRTPDSLFQTILTWPGITPSNYDIASSGKDSKGKTIALAPVALGVPYDLGHSHPSFVAMYDGGKMDGADKIMCSGTCPSHPQYRYIDNSSGILNPYLELATEYGWANSMFQTNQGPSFPAHQFLFGGTSAPSASLDAAGSYVAENYSSPKGANYNGFSDVGCLAPVGEWNFLIQPDGSEKKFSNQKLGTFCFSRPTMASLLDQSGLSWKYYAQTQTGNPNGSNPGGSIWNAPNSIRSICVPDSTYTNCTGAEWAANVDLTPADVLTDINNCKLANVSWVTPDGKNSDHAGDVRNTGGPSWVAAIVNAIGNSKSCDGSGYWYDTAIVVTWDDWGGWYDHVAPPILANPFGGYQYGFRVPLLVVSAYTPKAYVSNDILDFGSILRFIEGTFSLTQGALKFADERTTTDLQTFFDFQKPPRQFKQIAAPLDANFFINDTSPPEAPDND